MGQVLFHITYHLNIIQNSPASHFSEQRTNLILQSYLNTQDIVACFFPFSIHPQGWEWETKLYRVLPSPLSSTCGDMGQGTAHTQDFFLNMPALAPPFHPLAGWRWEVGWLGPPLSSVLANARVGTWDMGQPIQLPLSHLS